MVPKVALSREYLSRSVLRSFAVGCFHLISGLFLNSRDVGRKPLDMRFFLISVQSSRVREVGMRGTDRPRTRIVGKMLLFSHKVSSTNDWVRRITSARMLEGVVAVAETQTGGRGRLGRKWFSPKGGVWFSVLLKPRTKAAETAKLVFVASLAVAEALRESYGLNAETKWPNDVLVNGKKICGILAEMKTHGEEVDYAIVGVGLNANFKVQEVLPKEVAVSATSVEEELRKQVDYTDLLFAVLERLDRVYERFLKEGSNAVLKRWKELAGFLGHEVTVKVDSETFTGTAFDVSSDGDLILRLSDGSAKEFRMGDVSLQMA
jgi:BirA family biotin operon repressor/biotin-[acetyl-CoA-carboxylase] ligase